ncbi:hypothetical protein D3C76_1301310 [compost metagenome]
MENTDDGCATLFGLFDQVHHRRAVAAVEGGGRLVQQQDGVILDKATGDIHPLLLTTGEGRRGQLPQALWHVELVE